MTPKRSRRTANRHTKTLNLVQMVLQRNNLLSAVDVEAQKIIGEQSIVGLAEPEPAQFWRSLADIANIAETLARMGLGGGPDAVAVIDRAQAALGTIHPRMLIGRVALTDDERDALEWLLTLHDTQLRVCTYGEFEKAYQTTANRMHQAMRGNAPKGAVVVTGEIGVRTC